MSLSFAADAHPDRPKILFVGPSDSSHTHSWIDLLAGAPFNVRLFALPNALPPDNWHVRTYVTAYFADMPNSETRARLFSPNRARRSAYRNLARIFSSGNVNELAARWLAKIVRQWQPDIVHTFGLDSGKFYFDARGKNGFGENAKWVLQTRGGSDLALTHLDPSQRDRIGEVMRACDQLLSDNRDNFRIARELGVEDERFAGIAPVPGTGGIEVDALASRWRGSPSRRRNIIWPKAYESPWSKVLPVFEALKLCWERIQPCEVDLLSTDAETRMWYWALPAPVREHCRIHERVPRARTLELMTGARVMLAPSLVDGIPNSMYEAMAAGALPIVSPLDTIRLVVEQERNVLFARNLYPEEISAALLRGMTDDKLLDAATQRNLELVRRIANRDEIRTRVVEFYESLAAP